MEQYPEQILKKAKTILLVDWPDQSIPRSLLNTGLSVYGFSPGGYSKGIIVNDQPEKAEGISVFEPRSGEKDHLVFERIEETPAHADIICIYRPETEHELIFKNQVLPSGAKTIWLQPPVSSSKLCAAATENGIKIVEGINIADTAAKI